MGFAATITATTADIAITATTFTTPSYFATISVTVSTSASTTISSATSFTFAPAPTQDSVTPTPSIAASTEPSRSHRCTAAKSAATHPETRGCGIQRDAACTTSEFVPTTSAARFSISHHHAHWIGGGGCCSICGLPRSWCDLR